MDQGKKRLAILVGCNYPNTRNELHGCINDVHGMRDLIVTRLGFDPADIVVLTDETGSPMLPTGANIRQALGSMVDRAKKGDVLFFHYSGHGTLIPAVKPHHGRHPRDEAIVPCDFNLITDVDFRELVDRLPKGAIFTMVSDSCHSGGLIDKEKEQIGPSAFTIAARGLSSASAVDTIRRRPKFIPFVSVLHHLTTLSGIDSPHVGDHLSALFGADASPKFVGSRELRQMAKNTDDGILLSGCQANETSADMSPDEEDGGSPSEEKAFGAFSNAVQRVVRGMETASNRDVVVKVRELLREQGFEQHPCLYCSDHNADKPFLATDEEVAPAGDVCSPGGK